MQTYANVFPLSQSEFYSANSNVDFLLNLEGSKLVPGTLVVEGELAVFPDVNNTAAPYAGEDILFDPFAGAHALMRDITTETQNQGVLESINSYPRLAKMTTVATAHYESLPCETSSAIELKCSNEVQVRGLLYGRSSTDPYIPFSLKPLFCLNKASSAISGTAAGQIRLRLRLADNGEFLYGTGITSSSGYLLKNLRCRYVTVPDDGKKEAVAMEVYSTYRSALDSTNVNISTFIPGQVDAFHMSFIPQSNENTLTQNYLQMAVPPGQPPHGLSGTYTGSSYGIERATFAINDFDSAVVQFQLESREELVFNGLRSFNQAADKYAALIRHFNKPVSDCYLIGLPLGGLMNFSQSKLAVELQSMCSNVNDATGVFICYLYARGLINL